MAHLNSYPLTDGFGANKINLVVQTSSTTATTAQTYAFPGIGSGTIPVVPIVVKIFNLSAETIALTGTYDGANYSASLLPIDASTGQWVATAALTNGTYLIPATWMFQGFKTVKSAGVGPSIVVIAAVTMPKS